MLLKDFLLLDIKDIKGKVVCFPTDTVYGVGCILFDNEAVEKIYSLKNRDLDKPLATLVPNPNSVLDISKDVSEDSLELMNKYWPGALTIIFPLKENLNLRACCNLDTIGLRMPNSNIALAILNKLGPMATTSVNISGEAPLNDLSQIKSLFGDKIDYYIDDLQANISKLSSTVVKIVDGKIVILRQGDVII